ncbi:MAG TPA: HutD family protein [Steroidobacteraceae bacterium]|nr:HutD family protein [Steroidobacteraceae bacterium]
MSAPAPPLEVLRAAERAPLPWKNGGGLTREVAVCPAGSDLAGFDWRVSIAEIRSAGPFSSFPGIDRRMVVLSGRLSLAIEGRAAVTLTPESEAVAFPGEVPVFGEPLAAPVIDLNVMTRRTRCAARLTRRSARESAVLEPRADATLLVALSDLIVRRAGAELSLSALDALRIGRGPGCTITPRSSTAAYQLIEII